LREGLQEARAGTLLLFPCHLAVDAAGDADKELRGEGALPRLRLDLLGFSQSSHLVFRVQPERPVAASVTVPMKAIIAPAAARLVRWNEGARRRTSIVIA